MFKIKTYSDLILESYLMSSKYFEDIIKDIDDPIAKKFLELSKMDINTNYNALNITDNNKMISFMSDNQFQNKLKDGIHPYDLFTDNNNKTSIGRIIRSIFKDNNINLTHEEVDTFIKKFKSSHDKYYSNKNNISIISGEEIKKWYLEDSYNTETILGKGTLGKSCMRFNYSTRFIDMYIKNPEQCKLIINLNSNKKLLTRCLLWETNEGPYLDRIYFTEDHEIDLISDWIDKKINKKIPKYHINEMKRMSIILTCQTGEYENYPYMDSFPYYNIDNSTLYNYDPNIKSSTTLYLQETDGSYAI